LRDFGADNWDLSVLPAKRVAVLARWAQTASNQALAQSSEERRYPALLAFGAERLVGVIDGLVDLFDKLLADTNAKARRRLGEYRQSVAVAANDKVLLFAEIARVLLDPDLEDQSRLQVLFEAERLKHLVRSVFPRVVELTEVVVAVDTACGFSEHLLHTVGATSRSPAMLTHLYAAVLAQATNLGPAAMARASGLSYDQIAHATAWYLRDETLTAAIDTVINYHHRLPAARLWGDGTFSSSDGQRFPVQVKALNAGALPRYFGFGKGISVLTSVTDHYATYGTRVIATKAREGLFALDEIFALRDRDSELAIAEHTTDTAGFTDLLFGAYDLVGLAFSPRIRDLADQRLWCLDGTDMPALVRPLVANRANTERVVAHWDELLRLGASVHEGIVPPSLILTKLQAYPRQNALAAALQEYGRLVKTLFVLRYLQRPELRKRVGGQLNKGESLQGLRDRVNFAHHGDVRHRQIADQAAQALCLSLVVNCIAAFNADLLGQAADRLRDAGFDVADDDIAHLGPTMTEHLNVHGRYYFDLTSTPKPLRPAPKPSTADRA